MRRLTTALLALFLATTALALPAGWVKDGSRYLNEGVAAQTDARSRGGAFHLDLDAKELQIRPWLDDTGDNDLLSMRPVLPNGTSLGTRIETNWGWKWPMVGGDGDGWALWLVDMQLAKIPDAFDDFLADGVAVVYGSIPVGDVPNSGLWRAKQIRFIHSYDDYNFAIQPDLSGNPDVTQPKWVPGSIAIYHKDKKHNRPGARYMTGKVAHLPRPLMVGWRNGEITGWAFGVYEDLGGGVFEKVFDMNAIVAAGDMTREGIGNPQMVSVSADVGYTTMGAQNEASAANVAQTSGTTLSGVTGTVTSLVFGTSTDRSDLSGRGAVYTGSGTSADQLIAQGDYKNYDSIAADGAGWWRTYTVTAGTATVGPTDTLVFAYSPQGAALDLRFDVGQAGEIRDFTHTTGAVFPDTAPVSALDRATSEYSAYAVITEGGGGDGADQSGLNIGLPISL